MANGVNLDALAAACNLSKRRVQQLVGLGVIARPIKGRFDLIDSLKRYIVFLQNAATHRESVTGGDVVRQQRARLLDARATDAEIDLSAKRGELVPLQAVEEMMSAMILQSRQQLLQLPARVCAELEGEPRHIIKHKLTAAIHAALTSLAERGNDPPTPVGQAAADPAPAVNGGGANGKG